MNWHKSIRILCPGFAECRLPKDNFPVGYRFDTENVNFPVDGLTFLGLISLIDPPRSAVPSAVATCQEAGTRNNWVFYFSVFSFFDYSN